MTNKDKQDVIAVCNILADKMSDSGQVAVQQIIGAVEDMVENEPCEDCISREAVFAQINDWQKDEFLSVTNPLYYLHKRINSLPSVTPQQKATGSWVEKQVVDNEEVEIEQWQSARCSKCDKYHTTPYSYYFNDYTYCPNCGAKMEVEDENKTK